MRKYTFACRPEEKRRCSSTPAACRLFFLPLRPSDFSSSQTLSFAPRNEQGPRVRSPPRTRAHPFSRPFLRLSLSRTLNLLSYPRTRTYTRARHALTLRSTARSFYSPVRSAVAFVAAFFLISLVCAEIEFLR